MTLRKLLRQMPPGTLVPRDWILERLDDGEGGPPEVLTTHEAARWLGKSADWWQEAARKGHVEGAWQDGDGRPWNLPLYGCRDHLDRLERANARRRDRRGPWKRTTP